MRARWKTMAAVPVMAALALGGCGDRTPTLAADPIERAASCGVIAAASERQAVGMKGNLPAEAQARIFHYPLLAASTGATFDNDTADAVFKRMPALFDGVVKGKWQRLKPVCAAAFPATQVTTPTLPDAALDSMLQCYVLVDFMRRALGGEGSAYGEAVNSYGVFADKLDAKLSPALARAGIREGAALQHERAKALAAAAKLGQPSAVLKTCQVKYG